MSFRFWKNGSKKHSRRYVDRSRRFRLESLERRELLAGDVGMHSSIVIQNEADPYDVDRSGRPAAIDALLVANHLNGRDVTGVSLDAEEVVLLTTLLGRPPLDSLLFALALAVGVLVDEAHRTQAGDLHANLLAGLPNCARIGFTGTPIIMGEKKRTHEIFEIGRAHV